MFLNLKRLSFAFAYSSLLTLNPSIKALLLTISISELLPPITITLIFIIAIVK